MKTEVCFGDRFVFLMRVNNDAFGRKGLGSENGNAKIKMTYLPGDECTQAHTDTNTHTLLRTVICSKVRRRILDIWQHEEGREAGKKRGRIKEKEGRKGKKHKREGKEEGREGGRKQKGRQGGREEGLKRRKERKKETCKRRKGGREEGLKRRREGWKEGRQGGRKKAQGNCLRNPSAITHGLKT
ncbi:Octapeptide-repeat protein T2, partial [Ophiophagus hannah]